MFFASIFAELFTELFGDGPDDDERWDNAPADAERDDDGRLTLVLGFVFAPIVCEYFAAREGLPKGRGTVG